ncbi:MAG TPA: hemolysin III family protein [Chthoniobacterales bacterium]|nr:hemolysin III family protein [Chthoniobacterales bacterium]
MNVVDEVRASARWSQSHGEEIANSISHGLGVVGAAIGAPILLKAAFDRGSAPFLVGTAIFVATMLLLYLGSAVYHSWPRTRFKGALQTLDHSAIFLLIAGTYTPFTLGPLRGPWGWTILALIWALAGFGVMLKMLKGVAHRPRLAVGLYLGMGWLVLIVIRPIAHAVPLASLLWLLAGGVIYTAGVIFFVLDHKRYCHFIWHLFVLGGTGCHYFAVLSYAG